MKYTCACHTRHDAGDTCPQRRHLLGMGTLAAFATLAAAGTLGALAGCSESAGGKAGPAPVDFGQATACELDGMLLADYPGPKAQVFYQDAKAPEFFCDTVELFAMLLRPEQVRAVAAVYVQDMAEADWEQPRGHWTDARSAWYVRGSKRMGSMGPTLASFAREADARKFAAQYGGTALGFAEVKPEMADLRGGATSDGRM